MNNTTLKCCLAKDEREANTAGADKMKNTTFADSALSAFERLPGDLRNQFVHNLHRTRTRWPNRTILVQAMSFLEIDKSGFGIIIIDAYGTGVPFYIGAEIVDGEYYFHS